MFKPLTRTAKKPPKTGGGFAETQFLHLAGDDDYSGFAPTQMFGDEELALSEPVAPDAARAAASTSQSVLERAAATSAQAPGALQQAQATSQWVAAQEAKAHEAAEQARAVIAAQRRADERLAEGALATGTAPRTGLARLRAAFERLLPGGLLPLFIGVSVSMALISTALPLIDRH